MDLVKVVAELIFAILVSLPLSVVFTERFAEGWLQKLTIDLPTWVTSIVLFVVISAAFLLREQISVTSAIEKLPHHITH